MSYYFLQILLDSGSEADNNSAEATAADIEQIKFIEKKNTRPVCIANKPFVFMCTWKKKKTFHDALR